MDLTNLTKLTTKSKKRIGRGHGSGRGGHTSTRGAKGQKARGSVSLIFEGTKLKKSWVKRLPFLRGKGKFKSRQSENLILNLSDLAVFKNEEEVTISSLKKKKILPEDYDKNVKVKILSRGEVTIPLLVSLPCSKKAAEKIKKAGGKVIEGKNRD